MSYLRRLRELDTGDAERRLDRDPLAVPFNYFASPYADLFVDLTGGPGSLDELSAIAWAESHGWPDIVATLRAADRRCEALAAADNEAGFRRAVAQLVELFHAIRVAYAAHPEARDAARPAQHHGAREGGQ